MIAAHSCGSCHRVVPPAPGHVSIWHGTVGVAHVAILGQWPNSVAVPCQAQRAYSRDEQQANLEGLLMSLATD